MENNRFLLINESCSKVIINPDLNDEINNPGSLVFNYSYLDNLINNYDLNEISKKISIDLINYPNSIFKNDLMAIICLIVFRKKY